MLRSWRRELCCDATASARQKLLKLAVAVVRGAGPPSKRRRAHRENRTLRDIAALEHSLHEALTLFEQGISSGLALHDRATTSILARACCIPHAPWERRERARSLWLFDCTQAPAATRPADSSSDSHVAEAERWQCAVPGCMAIARWGRATDGFCRACDAHRRQDEVRVDMEAEALHAIADSISTSDIWAAGRAWHPQVAHD